MAIAKPVGPDIPAKASRTMLTSVPTRLLLSAILAIVGVSTSAAAYQYGRPDGPMLYWGILPGAPFLLLAFLALVTRMPLSVVLGASAGSLLAVALPYGLLLYTSFTYSGGGANIGVGILLVALPLYLPILMAAGGFISWKCAKLRQ
jgi:hypothetical protein